MEDVSPRRPLVVFKHSKRVNFVIYMQTVWFLQCTQHYISELIVLYGVFFACHVVFIFNIHRERTSV